MSRRPLMAFAVPALLALAGCATGEATAPPPETVTVTAPAPEQAPEPATPAVQPPPAPTEVPAAPAPAAPATFVMPAVVGLDLQLAQDTLQSLGSYLMDQTDAAGLGRLQINDSNWQVCAQDPAPGAEVPVETIVTLAAVKLAETCP